MEFKRSKRVGDLIKREISSVLIKDYRDPELGFVTITRVILSDDLRYAKVYCSVMGSIKDKDKTLKALRKGRKFIKQKIGEKLSLKYMPEINFFIDNTLDYVQKIEKLISELKDKGELL